MNKNILLLSLLFVGTSILSEDSIPATSEELLEQDAEGYEQDDRVRTIEDGYIEYFAYEPGSAIKDAYHYTTQVATEAAYSAKNKATEGYGYTKNALEGTAQAAY